MNLLPRIPTVSSRTVTLVLLGVGLFSTLRGLRFPNVWSYTHYLFNYDFGLVKRGLVGAIVSATGIDALSGYRFFFVLSFVILLLCLALLFRLTLTTLKSHGNSAAVAPLVFLSSVSVVYLSHTVGYFDQIGLLLTLFVLTSRNFTLRFLLGVAGTLFCLFVHEAFLILFFPILFLSLLRDCLPDRRFRLVLLSLYTVTALATTWYLTDLVLPEETVHQAYAQTQQTTPITLREDAFDVQFRTGPDNAAIMDRFWSEPMRWLQLFNGLLVTIPSIGVIACFTQLLLKARRESVIIRTLAAFAALSPFVLNIVAWDMERFAALAVLTSFLVYLVVATSPSDPAQGCPADGDVSFSTALMLLSLGVVLLNFNSSILLFDGYTVAQFPFPELSRHLVRLVLFGDSFFTIPAL